MAETFHLLRVSSYKLFTFCDVLHETKQKRKQILESAQHGLKSSLTALKKKTEQKYIKKRITSRVSLTLLSGSTASCCLPMCFTAEQSTVEASLFVTRQTVKPKSLKWHEHKI